MPGAKRTVCADLLNFGLYSYLHGLEAAKAQVVNFLPDSFVCS